MKIVALLTGALTLIWLLNTPAGLLGKADAVGYAVCHRIDLRSFHLGARQLPLCARCTGQYLGAMLGLIYLSLVGRRRIGRPPWDVIAILGILAGAWALDGFNSFLHLFPGLDRLYLYAPNNTLRLLTGTGVGIGISVALFPAFRKTVWKRVDRRPALSGLLPLGGLLALGLLVDFLVLTENPLVLYPLALISAGGVLVLLTLVYTMVWVMLFRRENHFSRLSALIIPLMAGFVTAVIQIGLLDYIRFVFTGTWGGFHFG